jgi:hypothetical protein
LAQQYEVVRLVRLVQGILDFHSDTTRQQLGLAPATDAGAAFVIDFRPASSESSRSDFSWDRSARLAERAKVSAGGPVWSIAKSGEAPPAAEMSGLASTPATIRATSVRLAARNASDLIWSPGTPCSRRSWIVGSIMEVGPQMNTGCVARLEMACRKRSPPMRPLRPGQSSASARVSVTRRLGCVRRGSARPYGGCGCGGFSYPFRIHPERLPPLVASGRRVLSPQRHGCGKVSLATLLKLFEFCAFVPELTVGGLGICHWPSNRSCPGGPSVKAQCLES